LGVFFFLLPMVLMVPFFNVHGADIDLQMFGTYAIAIVVAAIFFRLTYPDVEMGWGRKGLLIGSAVALLTLAVIFAVVFIFLDAASLWRYVIGDAQPPFVQFAPTIATVLAIVALASFEEVIFRGLLLNVLMERWGGSKRGVYLMLIIPGMVFGALHMYMGDILTNLVIMLWSGSVGIFWGALYLRFGSLWAVMLSHSLFNIISLIPFIIGIEDFRLMVHIIDVQNTLVEDTITHLILSPIVLAMAYFLARGIETRDKSDEYKFANL